MGRTITAGLRPLFHKGPIDDENGGGRSGNARSRWKSSRKGLMVVMTIEDHT